VRVSREDRRWSSLLWILAAGTFFSALPAVAGEGLVYRGGEIAADTTWSGEVKVVGALVVRKGATLTIAPGTVIRFAWVDENGDGIGDGELNVEGRLLAQGTRERMITFTSAREKPAPKDWTYLMINLSRESRVEHCILEYAFTGLQVHFSTALVRNNVFRHNFEALRFSTADVRLERNDIVENTYGIRYESRGSEAVVSRNTIAGNEYGFFPVVKSTSSVWIAENNIQSRGYNVKLGEEQRADLDFRGNWWGTASAAAIEATFFDKGREPALGRVLYQPFLEKPVEECGMER
jgi:parallel beta-helix repeat protein